jgi:arsenite methyltransferase
MAQSGCNDFRMISKRKLTLNHPEIEKKCGKIGFYSMTLRAFKLDLEDRCEDYGQVAYYLGTLTESPHFFYLDDHHTFEVGKPVPVCSNTAEMLTKTRYAQHFKVIGDLTQHFGLFDCGPTQMGSCC